MRACVSLMPCVSWKLPCSVNDPVLFLIVLVNSDTRML